MGLDIIGHSHSFRAGSYHGFHEFRDWLAQKLDYKDYNDLLDKTENIAGKWNDRKDQAENASKAVKCGALFHHSDCEGYIAKADARYLITDLIHIKEALPPLDNPTEDEEWFRDKLDDWILVCEDIINNEDRHAKITFC